MIRDAGGASREEKDFFYKNTFVVFDCWSDRFSEPRIGVASTLYRSGTVGTVR